MNNIKLNTLLASLLLIVGLAAPASSYAEIAIIVHPSNAGADDPTLLKRIFLGKVKAFSNGNAATPVELPEGSATRSTFNSDFVGKSDAQMKSYWGRLVFTGKATAPLQAASDEAMVESVSNNPNLVGYIDASKVTDAVKVVHRF
ncbi:phosphate ABC transporter substrate-binding protein [Oceanicoccus sp. KOV_DT_Chl]|uniref:phosphate ABC transporter substrate-binding protein n=1 Tax=Oceanicoccus sp. KOV_DT_Chl TaxID=1904639 RepID=UPI000C7A5183|nr:phosphate ABC transporter substrate-binding protein [Oceanicoccus sp. KOV_DT_Chl]